MNQHDLDNLFTYHAPTKEQQGRYAMLRAAGKVFAECILSLTPACSDQSTAIRKTREAVYAANAAIACEEAKCTCRDNQGVLVGNEECPLCFGRHTL